MNEVRALFEALDHANANGERCALATVVSVEGSSYRRPGARMLVCEGGTSTGAISAGCLEADVIEHAKRVITTGTSKILEYNTAATSDEMAWGLGLGCNGIVRVLLEPLAPDSVYVEALRRSGAAPVLVATVYRHTATRSEIGGRIVIDEDGILRSEKLSVPLTAALETELRALSLVELNSGVTTLDVCGGGATVFIERLMPPVPIVIFGAGPDALPIVEFARSLGWHTEVVDPQARQSSIARFAIADRVTLSRPEDIAAKVVITPRTLTILMSHNYAHDRILLEFLLASPARYIGIMGPRARTERMLGEMAEDEDVFRLGAADLSRVYSPAGLDIGANGSAEIAVSIVAEMRAVLDGRRGGMLRERRESIHASSGGAERLALPHSELVLVA